MQFLKHLCSWAMIMMKPVMNSRALFKSLYKVLMYSISLPTGAGNSMLCYTPSCVLTISESTKELMQVPEERVAKVKEEVWFLLQV